MDNREYLTLKQAATIAGLSPTTLRVQIFKKRMDAVKVGRDLFVTPEALQAYLDSRPDDDRRKQP